ncbi:MAG: fused DSP-PTPase phosphatase/NAD kinase-like protein [Ktedonobacteraceae bacterium]
MLTSYSLEVRNHVKYRLVLLVALMVAISTGLAQQADAEDLVSVQNNGIPPAVCIHAPKMVPNFQQVSTGIWRGSAPSHAALDALAQDGVRTIVDLRMDGSGVDNEQIAAHNLGINYYHFALGFKAPESDKIRDILAVMTDPANQPVFIHCRQGADRTGMLCGIYRRVWEGWSFERTYHEMREHHFKPFLLTMSKLVRNANLDRSIAVIQAKHPALIAAVSPAPTAAKPASTSADQTTQKQQISGPEPEAASPKNLLVVQPHRNIN